MPAFTVPAALEHVDEADEVGVNIRVWIDQRIAYSRLRGDMNHVRKAMGAEECCLAPSIRKIKLLEPEIGERSQLGEAGAFQRRIDAVEKVLVIIDES
jgi:hypothetical protein